LDRQTRIGIGATAALGIIGIVFPMIAWQIAYPLIAMCGIVAIWGLWPLVPWTFQVGLPLGYTPLDRAAAKLYGQMQGTAAAEFAQRSSNSPSEILNWFAYWMVLKGIRAFGKMPPSPLIQEIPRAEIESRLHFNDGAKVLTDNYKSDPLFTNLVVKRRDLFSHRRQLREQA
jgi:xanthosine utilization system XapX-like protein